jgi:iron complex transport system substrate-binding protein
LGRKGTDSVRVPWREILAWAPEILLVMPCGCDLKRALKEAASLASLEGWTELPAVRSGRVYALDANSYFARPGPRVVDGTELLAHLLHPDLFGWNGPKQAFQRFLP